MSRGTLALVHGFLGFDSRGAGNYFRGVVGRLRRDGWSVLTPRLPPAGSMSVRAACLVDALSNVRGPLHLMAHSMGGLDCRYAISRLGLCCLSMTTFGTPHRGSAFADWAIRHLRVVSPFLPFPVSTLHELGSDGCAAFNAETPDDPCVRYFWVAAKSSGELPFPWTFTHSVVCSGDGENDGLVSVRSARWGESLGVWEGSHSNLINWPFSGPDRSRAWSEIAQRVSGS